MLEDTRSQAMDRMAENATAMGATMSEVVAYGTAAVVEPKG